MVSALSASQFEGFYKGFLVYVGLGPPIGAAVLWIEDLAATAFQRGDDTVLRDLGALLAVLPFGYLFGLVPAAVVGAIVARLNVRYRGLNWAHISAIGLMAGFALMLWSLMRRTPIELARYGYLGTSWEWILICLAPTLACWRIIRRWRIRLEGT